jgi:hypothetical protein
MSMSFETLLLEPVTGKVDVAMVREWLDTAPFAVAIEPDVWLIGATPRLALLARLEREDDPAAVPVGVTVWVDAARVGMTAYADDGAMARTRDFVRWLSHMGDWMAQVDRAPATALADVESFFGTDLPATDTLIDDLTVGPVVMGTLTRWGGHGHQLHVHSGGQVRFEAPGRTIRAEIDSALLERWNAAVEAANVDDPALPDDPPERSAVTVEIETSTDTGFAMLDATDPPPSMIALGTMAEAWTQALTQWDSARAIHGLTGVREAS